MSDYEDNDNYDSDHQEEADDDSITEEASSQKMALFKPVIVKK